MVPRQRFNEMKPNSGLAGAEPGRSSAKIEFENGSVSD
jgi:hypothetical protein